MMVMKEVAMARVGVFLISSFFICLAPILSVSQAFAAEARMLNFGRVFDDPVRAIRDRQEFVDYLAKKLAPVGITGGKIVVVDKMYLLVQALKEGRVDLFHDSVAPTLVVSKASGAIPILRQWKYGEAEYAGIIVVKKSAGINTLGDLRGKVIAFDEPHSTSTSILPRMFFAQKKLKLMEVKPHDKVKPDSIGYIYGADGSSVNVMVTGKADAAVTIHRDFDRIKPEIRNSLMVLGTTMAAPRNIVAIRKDLDPRLAKELKEILLNMDKDPEGQEVLKRSQNTTKFDEISPEAQGQIKQIEKYVFSALGKEVDSW